MNILAVLQNNPLLVIIIVALLGACIGSFLNVVIYRLPIMLYASWKHECHELLETGKPDEQESVFNLSKPRSYCYYCNHLILGRHNIPLLSYLLLMGKCAYCKHRISIQYFLVELSCTLLSIFLTLYYGLSWQFFGVLLLTWCLIPLIMIDLKEQLLPDEITLPLVWIGLIFNIFNTFTSLKNAIIGAIAGYLILWLITYLYKLLTKKIGMGNGDFKLLAVFGAWLGWQFLPLIIFVAAVLGTIIGLVWLISTRQKTNATIAFGPYLAVAGWFALIFQNHLYHWYSLIL